jgi:hypothetical protein
MTIESLAMRGKLATLFLRARTNDTMLGTAGVMTGQGAGAPVEAAMGGYTVVIGVDAGADNDEICWIVDVPTQLWHFDLARDIRAQVLFQHQSTDADTPIFSIRAKGYANQAALSDPDSSPDGTITFPAVTCSTTDNSIEKTGIMGFKSVAWASDELVLFNLRCDTISAGANEISIIGVRLFGTLLMTESPPTPRQLT